MMHVNRYLGNKRGISGDESIVNISMWIIFFILAMAALIYAVVKWIL